MIGLELLVVVAAIFVGARVGGVGLGTIAGLGLAVLVFGFGLPPSAPPGAVLAIVVAVVTAAATMQAAGGMDVLVGVAERTLRARPQWITFVAPAVAYLFTFCSGTGHVAYAILPVIAEVARKAGVRPERPLSISVIASQQAITASPLAAATVGLLAILTTAGLQIGGVRVELWHILAVCVPSTVIGFLLGALSVAFVGKKLEDDPIYRERLEKGLVKQAEAAMKELDAAAAKRAKGSVAIFLVAALSIVFFGLVERARPSYTEVKAPPGVVTIDTIDQKISDLMDPERRMELVSREQIADALQQLREKPGETRETAVGMGVIIQIVMYSAAALMTILCGAKPGDSVKTPVAAAGVVAVVSIIGLGWMGNCFFDGNKGAIVGGLSDVIRAHPWVFALGLFGLSVVLFSQASTVAALMPLGIALGLPATTLIAFFPAVNGYFFLPTYGTIVAAVAFDSTGTTRIGRYVLNHSFMLPGLVSTAGAIVAGLLMTKILF
jgi:anaerobic C4-dicarboxylate transporter DcuA